MSGLLSKGVEIVIDLWGPYACFTPPYAKVERISYAVPTPSALRNILNAVYCKPVEFHWEVREIQVMSPIRYLPCRRNEVKHRYTGGRPLLTDDCRTQRAMTMLKDVYYRVRAVLIPKEPGDAVEASLRKQALRRIQKGQCFWQPYFGIRECECYFALSDFSDGREPIRETMDFGLMVYDTHIPGQCSPGYGGMDLSLYHCSMVDGVIKVPPYDSDMVIKHMEGVVGC